MDKRLKDHTGEKYGLLTIIERGEKTKDGHCKWKCICECGNITYSTLNNLVEGRKISCGCKKTNDLTGKRFGRYTVLKRWEKLPSGHSTWLCQCDCGNVKTVLDSNLHKDHVVSCGCVRKEKYIDNAKWAGESNAQLYAIWRSMLTRCCNPKVSNYKYYGGRGIKVCKEWLDEKNGYFAFRDWALGNGYTDNLSIERIDVNGDYSPSNCKWIPLSEQKYNKRSNHYITYNGETKCLIEWANIYGINRSTLFCRLKRGWSIDKALNEPVNRRR